jgi:hypothetical protein
MCRPHIPARSTARSGPSSHLPFVSSHSRCLRPPTGGRSAVPALSLAGKLWHDSQLLLDTAAVEENIVSKQRQVRPLSRGRLCGVARGLTASPRVCTQLLDARPKPRYVGAAPEPRPIESGHIEGSYCVPWTDVLTAGAHPVLFFIRLTFVHCSGITAGAADSCSGSARCRFYVQRRGRAPKYHASCESADNLALAEFRRAPTFGP